MSEQEKKRQRIYDLFNVETKPKFLSTVYKPKKKKKFLQKKNLLRKKRSGGLIKNQTKKDKNKQKKTS